MDLFAINRYRISSTNAKSFLRIKRQENYFENKSYEVMIAADFDKVKAVDNIHLA